MTSAIKKICLFLSLFAVPVYAANSHFVDSDGNDLPQFDVLWVRLSNFYGAAVPNIIYADISNSAVSEFEPPDHIHITPSSYQSRPNETIIHETSHLANWKLSNGQTAETAFRFIDEGFATVWQESGTSNAGAWKTYLMKTAKACSAIGKVSFALAQDWSHYFGDSPSNFHYDAYNVGASFVYFLQDTFGDDKLKEFLAALGSTQELGAAVQMTFGVGLGNFEAQWIAYIGPNSQGSHCNLP